MTLESLRTKQNRGQERNGTHALCIVTYQNIALSDVHVFVHEVEDGEPEGGERGEGEEGVEVLQENLHTGES